jgi:selenocysteine lyase/cysteine desulfurase
VSSERALFDVPPDVTYLNAASLAPRLSAVSRAGADAVRTFASPWLVGNEEWFGAPERLRALAAEIMHADADGIAIVPAVSYGIAVAAANVVVARGQSIVVLEHQFPSNVYAWRDLARARGARLVTVRRAASGMWTDAILEVIDADTAVVAVPNCHWTDGSLIDLARVSARTRSVGAQLVVDASQSLGAYPIDVAAIQPDFLVSVGYKWLLGPLGLGYLYVAERWRTAGVPLERSWLTRAGSENFGSLIDYTDEYRSGARRFDMGEFPQFILLPMACAGLEQILRWGVDRIQQSLATLTQRLAVRARERGYVVADDQGRVGHMVGLRRSSGIPSTLAPALARAKVYVSIRGDAIRVAPHLHNDADDIDRLVACLDGAMPER